MWKDFGGIVCVCGKRTVVGCVYSLIYEFDGYIAGVCLTDSLSKLFNIDGGFYKVKGLWILFWGVKGSGTLYIFF